MIRCDQNDFYLQRNVWNSSYKLQVTDWTRVVSVWARIVQSVGPAKVEAWILAELTELLQTSHCTVSVQSLYTGLAMACTDVTCFTYLDQARHYTQNTETCRINIATSAVRKLVLLVVIAASTTR